MSARVDILALISARRTRRPARIYLALDGLFSRLAACRSASEARPTEDRIWDAWMHHPHEGAERVLELATRDIAARRYDIAETRLTALLRSDPAFAEAWHKRATLYYLLGQDDECLADLRRTLELEPRHFAAMLHFAEILAAHIPPAAEDIRVACAAALSLHPHLDRARELVSQGPVNKP